MLKKRLAFGICWPNPVRTSFLPTVQLPCRSLSSGAFNLNLGNLEFSDLRSSSLSYNSPSCSSPETESSIPGSNAPAPGPSSWPGSKAQIPYYGPCIMLDEECCPAPAPAPAPAFTPDDSMEVAPSQPPQPGDSPPAPPPGNQGGAGPRDRKGCRGKYCCSIAFVISNFIQEIGRRQGEAWAWLRVWWQQCTCVCVGFSCRLQHLSVGADEYSPPTHTHSRCRLRWVP
jgi:hypothetical protein